MKKAIVFIVSMFILTSCFQNQEAVNNAKKELGILNKSGVEKTNNSQENKENKVITEKNTETTNDTVVSDKVDKNKEIVKKEEKFIIKSLTMNNFIELDDLNSKTFHDGEIEITGKTLLNVDKINVTFVNKTSDFPEDNYTLKQFKSGDKTFTYRAFSRYQTLDYGKNEYIFTAYSGEKTSKLSLIINIEKPNKENIDTNIDSNKNITNDISNVKVSYEKKKIGGENNIKYLNFPKSNAFGEMISTGNNSFTYSKIDNLNVIKKDVSNISCSNISDILSKSIKTWYYWNTCRDIIKDKGIKFNVLKLDGDSYIYERHYVDYNNGFYGEFVIETGTGVTKDNIKEKNNELKDKEFTNIKLVDNLFYEIVR